MLSFEERGKPEYPKKNLSQQGWEPTTNCCSLHLWKGCSWFSWVPLYSIDLFTGIFGSVVVTKNKNCRALIVATMIISSVAIFFKGVLKIGRRFIVFVETLYIMVASCLKRVTSTLSHLRKLRMSLDPICLFRHKISNLSEYTNGWRDLFIYVIKMYWPR